jgi:hypothetical protein
MSRENETDLQDSYATARAADQVADRRTDEALSAAAAAGELVSHEFADACSLGLWHTGGCERN